MESEFKKRIIKTMTDASLPHLFFDCLNEKHNPKYKVTTTSGKEICFKNINNMIGNFICASNGHSPDSEVCFNVKDVSVIELDNSNNYCLYEQPTSYRKQIESEE